MGTLTERVIFRQYHLYSDFTESEKKLIDSDTNIASNILDYIAKKVWNYLVLY